MREKAEDMKPILLKAGIPLALTLAGFLFSIIIIRGKDRSPQQDQSNSVDDHVLGVQELKEEDDLDGLHSTSLGLDERVVEEEEEVSHLLQTQDSVSLETSQIQCPNEVSESEAVIKQEGDEPNLKEEPEDQTNQVGAVQDVEGEVEVRFLHHCSLHEHGSALKELQSALELELAHVEFLGEKVESMAAENQRLEAITAEYPRVFKALLSAKSEVGLLRRRIKKLWKMNTEATHVLRRQALVMKAREAEISSKEEELQWKEGEIRELENAMVELRGAVDQMEKEKKALVDKLEVRESSATPTSKNEGEEELMGGYGELRMEYQDLLNQLEQFQKERAADAAELIRLRWANGCLRHELAKNQQSPEYEEKGEGNETEIAVGNDETKHCNMGNNLDGSFMGAGHSESNPRVADTKPAGSSRGVLRKLKKWVKGKEKQRDSFEEQEKSSAPENVEEIAATRNLGNHVTAWGGGGSAV